MVAVRTASAEIDSGDAHQVRDSTIHPQRRSRQFLRTGENNALVGGQFDVEFAQAIRPGAAPAGAAASVTRIVRSMDFARTAARRNAASRCRPSTMKLALQAVFRQLVPKTVGKFRDQPGGRVSEVRRKRGARIDGRGDLVCVGGRVADGRDGSGFGDRRDVARALRANAEKA